MHPRDQSGLANIDGDGNQHLALNLCGTLDILEIYHFHVVDTRHWFCLEILFDNLNHSLRVALTSLDSLLTFLQTL